LYKLLCRQIANNMGYTACFLPKPIVGVNGSGMHTNVSVSEGKTNLFWDAKGEEQLSRFGWEFLDRILSHALDLCLIFNSSVNAYRRLDPHFEAPNQIRASAVDRGAMVRVPIGNHRSMRTEVRAVAPDANPYLALYGIFKTGVDGQIAKESLRGGGRYLPDNIQTAINDFKASKWIAEILGSDVQGRYTDLKQAAANRSPRELGGIVKDSEVQFHHAVYNQSLWNLF
ncbi:MAG: glutamine synthetase family protein, partial [Terracidiphilus sp.]